MELTFLEVSTFLLQPLRVNIFIYSIKTLKSAGLFLVYVVLQ